MNDQDKTREQLLKDMDILRREKGELQRLCSELRAQDRAKEDALRRVSHELRTPVAAIRSFAAILLDYPSKDSKTDREYLSIIRGESERLGRMIDSLMGMSKMKQGKTKGRFEKIRIRAVVEEAAKAVGSLASEKGVNLETRIEPALPAFTADVDGIRQLLNNILGNAIGFTPPGGRISIEAEFLGGRRGGSSEGSIHLWVRDTGIGIRPEELPHVFDRFRQCEDALMRRPAGLGLGLFLCKEIVNAHHGNIWVESVHGAGSTFHVTLPVEASQGSSYEDSYSDRKYTRAEQADTLSPVARV
jgi:signal transduction histidine kinase